MNGHELDTEGRCKKCRLHVTEWDAVRCIPRRSCRGPACSCGACGKFDQQGEG